jgi:hypothetical protein
MKNWRTTTIAIIMITGIAGCLVAFLIGKISAQDFALALAAIAATGASLGLWASKDAKNP